jgi:MFS family permease
VADDLEPTGSDESIASIRPLSSFRFRDFRFTWIAILCANTSIQMRNVASLYQVYHLSGSSMQLGLTGFFQALPFVCFGLLGGVLADNFNRKKLIMSTQILNVFPGLALGVLTTTGTIQVWQVNMLSLLTSSLQVLSGPARQALVPSLVPTSHLMNAITLTTIMQQGTQLIAPLLAGYLIDFAGVKVSYFVDATLLLPALISILMLRTTGLPAGGRQAITVKSLLEGFEFIWRERIILALLLLDFFAVLVGYYRPILPIFASEVFHVGAGGLGALYAAPAIGAILGSAIVLAAGDIKHKGRVAVLTTFSSAISLGFLGFSRWLLMGIAAIAALGLSDSISVAIRRTLVQFLAPDSMRGRAASMLTVFAQATNALGAVIAGVGAALLGASNAAFVGCVLCAATIFAVCWAIPQLWRYRSD